MDDANGVGVIHFCAPENGGLHKILQPFPGGHVFCAFQFPTTRSRRRATRYSLWIVPQVFIEVGWKLFLWLRSGHRISCADLKGAALCYAVARTGLMEIMRIGKLKCTSSPTPPPPTPSKGRTIRKVMGSGEKKKTKKNSCRRSNWDFFTRSKKNSCRGVHLKKNSCTSSERKKKFVQAENPPPPPSLF